VSRAASERPDTDFGHFERIQNIHGNSIGTLIGEMPADSGTQPPGLLRKRICSFEKEKSNPHDDNARIAALSGMSG